MKRSRVQSSPAAESWVAGAADSDFGIANLPLGIFSGGGAGRRPGVAIGAQVCDLGALHAAALIDEPALRDATALNAFLAAGRSRWRALRARLQALFGEDADERERALVARTLFPLSEVTLHLPIDIGDYVDFYSSIEHATNVGRLFRPEHPLLPNYRHVPIGYHGRASTVAVSGTPVRRPDGQAKAPDADAPHFGPSRALDFELEVGFVVAGPGNPDGAAIAAERAHEHVYGCVLLADWSARDVQAWESQPLGPFLSKSFLTSISPWIVALDALEPFRVANRPQEPEPLRYLRTAEPCAYDIELEVDLETPAARTAGAPPQPLARVNFRRMYWNFAQQIAHLTSNGAVVRPGDLYGSGTVSGTEPGTYGCLLEATARGTRPLTLANGETRTFLEDGDTVVMRGRAGSGAGRVGFGELRGTIEARRA